MSHTKANYVDGDERADGMYFLRETLGCENLGVTVVDVEEVSMAPSDAVRVDPESGRRLHAETASTLVVAGAP